jgi:hypothetical protein
VKEYRVVIPQPNWVVVRFRQEDHPGVALVNRALAQFEPREVFAWHLSIMIRVKEQIGQGMPSEKEVKVLEAFEDSLAPQLGMTNTTSPNGLPLARITWNGTREVIFRIHDPQAANHALLEIIRNKSHPRPFDYRMDNDPAWLKAKWHLDAATRPAVQ